MRTYIDLTGVKPTNGEGYVPTMSSSIGSGTVFLFGTLPIPLSYVWPICRVTSSRQDWNGPYPVETFSFRKRARNYSFSFLATVSPSSLPFWYCS